MHIQRNLSLATVFFKDIANLYNMYKIKFHKTSKCLWPVFIDMFVGKLLLFFFFEVFINHFPQIHKSVLHKITIDLLYFWDVDDVNLCGSTVYSSKRNVFK